MPKTHKPILTESIVTPTNINELMFIGFDGNYCQANAKALGVSAVTMDQGQMAPVHISGVLLVTASTAITIGSKVASDANGFAVPYTTGESNGYALDNAANPGDIIRLVRGI